MTPALRRPLPNKCHHLGQSCFLLILKEHLSTQVLGSQPPAHSHHLLHNWGSLGKLEPGCCISPRGSKLFSTRPLPGAKPLESAAWYLHTSPLVFYLSDRTHTCSWTGPDTSGFNQSATHQRNPHLLQFV